MTTSPTFSDAEIESRIASVAAGLSQPRVAADTAWIAENVRRWLSSYMVTLCDG